MEYALISRVLLACTCLLFLHPDVRAQSDSDSVRRMIEEYKEPTLLLIHKGRALLLDKFLSNDRQAVRKIADFLMEETEDTDYLALYPAETWLLGYWTGDYEDILATGRTIGMGTFQDFRVKIQPLEDKLYDRLLEKIHLARQQVVEQINLTPLSLEEQRFLSLHFDYLLSGNHPDVTQEKLNRMSDAFLSSYPSSDFNTFIRSYIRQKYTPSKWGFGFEFFSGYGVLTDQLSENFSNGSTLGIAFDVQYYNFILYLRNYIGFGHTKHPIAFPEITWEEDAQSRIYLPEASIGYVAYDRGLFKVSPFAGIASMNISPTQHDIDKFPEYEDIGLDFTMTYVMGINLDITPGRNKVADPFDQSHWFIRLRYAYNRPQYHKNYDNFSGDFHYLTIGVGGFGRTSKRVD